jgi:aminoglycoside/choline kinase family phosphotransferase
MLDRPADRAELRRNFLAHAGLPYEQILALPADASFRRYFRLLGAPRPALVMDAPPGREDVRPFVKIARHLRRLGLSAPEILAVDDALGFVLLEDFGEDTFTRLLNSGEDPKPLYELAVDALAALHRHPAALEIELPDYEGETLIAAAALLPQWYLPARRGANDPAAENEFRAIWADILNTLPPAPRTLVIRDFHVDNLMLLPGRDGVAACGILDFQDAATGARPYDLMSLLQDARRDLPPDLEPAMIERYHERANTEDRPAFDAWYQVLAAQRHCRILGVFVRLDVRDAKPGYLPHLPRVAAQLARAVETPRLASLRAWLRRYLPDFEEPMPLIGKNGSGRAHARPNLASPGPGA